MDFNLRNLRESLDGSSHPASTSAKKSELRLTRDFKSAALQLTTLYRTSLSSAKRSYASGYAQSLHDILDVVLLRLQQSPASAPGYSAHLQQQQHHNHNQQQRHAHESNREELTWLVRYLQARIEAIRAESEDDEEDKESDEEEEEIQIARVESSKGTQVQPSLKNRTVIEASTAQVNQVEEEASAAAGQESIKEDDISEMQIISQPEKQVETGQASLVSPVIVPPSSSFNFTPPDQSFPIASVPSRNSPQGAAVRRKVKGGVGSSLGSSNVTPVLVAPKAPSSVSSEEEATVIQPQTPSKRLASRLGKRSSARDKADVFGKSISAKRRRGMGDRREDDRRDGGLH